MKNMTRAQRRRQAKIRKMLLSLSLVLVIGMAAVGGTIAWLTATTQTVTNTFTAGDITISLDEHVYDATSGELTTATTKTGNNNYKMVPGDTLPKDPYVTVTADSEDAWVFIKVEESSNVASFLEYSVDSAWTALPGVDGVYYREYASDDEDTTYSILTNNQVTVKGESVTKAMLNALTDETYPTLKFTAYAIQKDNTGDANAAWTKLQASL